MLLALDLGNTNLTAGVFQGGEIVLRARLSTRRDRTADEWGLLLSQLLRDRRIATGDIDASIVCSVVPQATGALRDGCAEYLGITPRVVSSDLDPGLEIAYDHPEEVGADRIVNAIGALERFNPPVVVVDFGTATTFDAVDARGRYLGGAIAPGIQVSMEALFQHAALLHRVRLVAPARAIGRSTEESLQSGIVLGAAGQVDALVRRMQAELGNAEVIATGGLAELVAPYTQTVRTVDRDLTLRGLLAIHRRTGGGLL